MTGEDMIYLCTIHELAGPGESVERQTTLLARVLEKLGYALVSDKEHVELWAMRPAALGGKPWSEPEGAIQLCVLNDLAGLNATDEQILKRMKLFAGMLHRLGWDLASGTQGRFHELWALRPENERE